jgi:glycosyltransferase involved in cell wall biosynthesis
MSEILIPEETSFPAHGYRKMTYVNSVKDTNKLLTLVVPVYNEEGHLQQFLELIDQVQFEIEKELIFVDDCSSDGTLKQLKAFQFKSKVRIIEHTRNLGKGAALRKGLAAAEGDIIGVQDADFEYSLEDIKKLLPPLLNNSCDVVFGSRYKKSSAQVHRTYHYLVNRILTAFSNLLSGLYLTDMETCYKFFKKEIIKNINLTSNRFGFEPEITAKIARLKIRVFEIPISYHPRNYVEGKKISWKDGVAAFFHIFKFNVFASQSKDYGTSLPKRYLPVDKQLL